MSAYTNTRAGVALMIAAVFVFAVQDGISRLLAERYNVFMIIMVRYWFFALFVVALAARQSGGLRRVAATDSFIPLGDAANRVLVQEEDIERAALALCGFRTP